MNLPGHHARRWENDATGDVECLVCGQPVTDTLFGPVHQGEDPAWARREYRPHPDDAAAYAAAVETIEATLGDTAAAGDLAVLAAWALYRAGLLRRRKPPGRRRVRRPAAVTPTAYTH